MVESDAILNRILKSQDNYTTMIEWNTDENPIYIGEAEPGTAISSSKWRIQKISWDINGNVTSIQWAGASREFKFKWDSRTTYTYT